MRALHPPRGGAPSAAPSSVRAVPRAANFRSAETSHNPASTPAVHACVNNESACAVCPLAAATNPSNRRQKDELNAHAALAIRACAVSPASNAKRTRCPTATESVGTAREAASSALSSTARLCARAVRNGSGKCASCAHTGRVGGDNTADDQSGQ